jgi:hypothetical protein
MRMDLSPRNSIPLFVATSGCRMICLYPLILSEVVLPFPFRQRNEIILSLLLNPFPEVLLKPFSV